MNIEARIVNFFPNYKFLFLIIEATDLSTKLLLEY